MGICTSFATTPTTRIGGPLYDNRYHGPPYGYHYSSYPRQPLPAYHPPTHTHVGPYTTMDARMAMPQAVPLETNGYYMRTQPQIAIPEGHAMPRQVSFGKDTVYEYGG